MEKGQLGASRKFKVGSIHQTASGKLSILDRFLGEDGKPYLKFEWITGQNSGQIEEAKEENINARLHKYKKSRGLETIDVDPSEAITLNQLNDKIDYYFETLNEKMDEIIDRLEEGLQARLEGTRKMEEIFHKQENSIRRGQEAIQKLMVVAEESNRMSKTNNAEIHALRDQKEMFEKLVDKI